MAEDKAQMLWDVGLNDGNWSLRLANFWRSRVERIYMAYTFYEVKPRVDLDSCTFPSVSSAENLCSWRGDERWIWPLGEGETEVVVEPDWAIQGRLFSRPANLRSIPSNAFYSTIARGSSSVSTPLSIMFEAS